MAGLISIVASSLLWILTGNDEKYTSPNMEGWINNHGYPVETHKIITADGYILTYHRIPDGKTQSNKRKILQRKPVFLQHGLLESSPDWVLSNNGMGFLLADAGFDVWMGNSRGNVFSRRHASLSPENNASRFWDFSWHEMGYYDLPAAIDYILKTTEQKQLFYIGFSMGTTMFLTLGASKPSYMAKVQAAFLIAPVGHPHNMRSPVVNLASKIHFLFREFAKLTDLYEFFPQSRFNLWLEHNVCSMWAVKKLGICEDTMKFIGGFNRRDLLRVPLKTVLKFVPAGTSYKTFDHFRQIAEQDFAPFDYGSKQNIQEYGSQKPLKFDFSYVTAPIHIYHATNDWLSVPEDVEYLVNQLPNVRKVRKLQHTIFNHLDFIWAKKAKTLVYDDIIATLSNLTKISQRRRINPY